MSDLCPLGYLLSLLLLFVIIIIIIIIIIIFADTLPNNPLLECHDSRLFL